MSVDDTKPCYICWFFTIVLAVATGNLTSEAIKAGIDYLSIEESSSNVESFESTKSTTTEEQKPIKEDTKTELSPDGELPIVKLSPKDIQPKNGEQSENDAYIKVLPEKEAPVKDIPKEKMPGYQTTLEICNYWKKEFKNDGSKQNEAYMEAACNRLESYK